MRYRLWWRVYGVRAKSLGKANSLDEARRLIGQRRAAAYEVGFLGYHGPGRTLVRQRRVISEEEGEYVALDGRKVALTIQAGELATKGA